MKVICIRQNQGREPQPQLGRVYDAEVIEVYTPDRPLENMYHIKELGTYSDYWVIPLREHNLRLI